MMPTLEEWAEVESVGADEVKVFPYLQHLEINECEKLMGAPSHFSSCLKHLKLRRISFNMPLTNIFRFRLNLLTNICLAELAELECLPCWLFYNNPNITELEIKKCPKLRELPEGLCTLKSLEIIIIEDCPSLEQIADSGREQSQESFTSLCYVKIHECHALVYLPCEMVGPSLKELCLVNLRSLMNLPMVIDNLEKSPHLTKLRIVGVPKFMASCVEVWPLQSLQQLDIDVSSGGSGSMETVDGILQGCCHSLNKLTLKGMEIWECLPDSIQHLTALSWLTLENFGVEELTEWFGNLSSLERLYLFNCKKLRRLASIDAMQSLTTLQLLIIKGCPELLNQSNADSEWPKISHVHYITIDGSRVQNDSRS